jgi:hypothetical protein
MEAFAALGYKPEQVTKILLTYKHADHSGELKSFPNAKIYVNADETFADELQGLDNIVPVTFTDGAYHNFPESQKIADGIYFIKAKGHTNGNSLIIAENEGLFYMFEVTSPMLTKRFTGTSCQSFSMTFPPQEKPSTVCVNLSAAILQFTAELTLHRDMKISKQSVLWTWITPFLLFLQRWTSQLCRQAESMSVRYADMFTILPSMTV